MKMDITEDATVDSEANLSTDHEDGLVMDPAMWSTLPKELIRLVFAHLPLPQLLNLRSSSLDGIWDINLDDSEFRRLCARIHSNLCAVIQRGTEGGIYIVGVHSAKSSSWQSLEIDVDEPFTTVGRSSDGGLVCFALSSWSSLNDGPSLVILVVNPLTGDCRELPGHGVHPGQLSMTQLVMDPNTKRYKLILVVHKFDSVGGIEAMLFDSGTGVWTHSKNSSELFLGVQHYFDPMYYREDRPLEFGSWAFDCATGKLFCLNDYNGNPCSDKCIEGCAFVKDRLFVLDSIWDDEDDVPMYSISEHQIQVQENGLSWTKLEDHQFDPIVHLGSFRRHRHHRHQHLYACKGFLLVVAGKSKNEFAWLYNLSTGDCLDLQRQRNGHQIAMSRVTLCELQWDVVP